MMCRCRGINLDPFFELILNLLISAITKDDTYSHLEFDAWYHDNGVLAGPLSAVHKALTLIRDTDPPLGLFV